MTEPQPPNNIQEETPLPEDWTNLQSVTDFIKQLTAKTSNIVSESFPSLVDKTPVQLTEPGYCLYANGALAIILNNQYNIAAIAVTFFIDKSIPTNQRIFTEGNWAYHTITIMQVNDQFFAIDLTHTDTHTQSKPFIATASSLEELTKLVDSRFILPDGINAPSSDLDEERLEDPQLSVLKKLETLQGLHKIGAISPQKMQFGFKSIVENINLPANRGTFPGNPQTQKLLGLTIVLGVNQRYPHA